MGGQCAEEERASAHKKVSDHQGEVTVRTRSGMKFGRLFRKIEANRLRWKPSAR